MKNILFFFLFITNLIMINPCAQSQTQSEDIIKIESDLKIDVNLRINKFIHSVFAEVLGDCVYGGIWVGKDSEIPNIDGIRKDFIEGCKEAGVTAMRWPGGVYADHYHWKYGIGATRKDRMYSAAAADMDSPAFTKTSTKGNEFGTDEFIKLCRLINAEPIIVANVATGSPEELLDWFEYCNGDSSTFWGSKRAENGYPEPFKVNIWALGNTDDNAWHIAYQDPKNYARDFLRFRTAIRHFKGVQVIGLGYSLRHNEPGWAGEFLDYVTRGATAPGPNSISIHYYSGARKHETRDCGPSVNYTDEQYYYSLNTIGLYQNDIDHHRNAIKYHTNPKYKTTISFDEWGFWHPDTKSGLRQSQTIRDGLFAGLSMHTFYRNCDIVEYAMETQVANVLQSLFMTQDKSFYKTPTFYAFKLLKPHQEQYLLSLNGVEEDNMLDCVMSSSLNGEDIALSVVNKHLAKNKTFILPQQIIDNYKLVEARTLTAKEVRAENTFQNPDAIKDEELSLNKDKSITVGPHSLSVVVYKKK